MRVLCGVLPAAQAAAGLLRDHLHARTRLAAENQALREQLSMLQVRQGGRRVRPGPWKVLRGVLRAAQALAGLLRGHLHTRTRLAAENHTLREDVSVVLARQEGRRLRPDPWERVILSALTRLFLWRERKAVPLFTPDTIARWHREAFRIFWAYRSRSRAGTHRGGRRRIPDEIRGLIREMRAKNGWGYKRIVGELLKLSISVHHETVARILRESPPPRAGEQRWATFVRNHLPQAWACDFFTVPSLFFRQLYVFVVLKLDTREILAINVTRHPTDQWAAQQLRNVVGWCEPPRFLVRDRDGKYGATFNAVVKSVGTRTLLTPARRPIANSYCERVIRTLRNECTDRLVPRSEAHLREILWEYVGSYYNTRRPHQGIDQRVPASFPEPALGPSQGRIVRRSVLNGLYTCFEREAPQAA